MATTNRAAMLTELIFTDKDKAEEAYDYLVPKYSGELRILYDILNTAKILGSCEVKLPNHSETELKVELQTSKLESDQVKEVISNNNGSFTPYKNSDSISVQTKSIKNGILLIFEN